MNKNDYYKKMFLIAALWNWIIAILMTLLSLALPSITKDFGMDIPLTWFFFHLLYFLVFLFGILFFVTGRELEKYHSLASIFVLEKVGAFIIVLAYYLIGDFNEGALLIGIGDLIFGILFLEYWIKFE
jgi:hypothetical protein